MALTIEEKQRRRELFGQGLKLCCKCGRILPLEKFSKCKSKGDGRESCCKECKARSDNRPNAGAKKRRMKERARLYALGLSKCLHCGPIKPIDEFYEDKRTRNGLVSCCKICLCLMRQENKGKGTTHKIERQKLQAQGLKRCSSCKQVFPIAKFYKGPSHTYDGLSSRCKQCAGTTGELQRRRQYQKELLEQGLKECSYCQEVKPIGAFYKNAGHSDGLASRCKTCNDDTPSRRMQGNKRRARRKNLPDDFSEEEWKQALEYFEHRCAYCGEECGNLVGEHFIPIARNGGTTRSNMVPSCPTCNFSKNASDPYVWAKKSERVLPTALARVEKYFATLLQED